MNNEAPPRIEPNCFNCAYRVESMLPPPNIGKQSLCYLLPPTPVAVNSANGVQIIPLRPPVSAKDYCYNFQPHPSLIAGAANDPPGAPGAPGTPAGIALPD